jgi:hypothetical protein
MNDANCGNLFQNGRRKLMKRISTRITLTILSLSVLVAIHAQAGEPCTEATLRGPYGFHTHGVTFAGQQLFASVGLVIFDGLGRIDVTLTSSRNGEILRSRLGGSYSVNSDCTGHIMNDTGGLVQDIVIVDGGNEIRSLARNPDSSPVWTGLYKKQRVEGCTAANMEGNWGYSFQGSILDGESFSPVGIIGWVTFDGVGSLTGTELRNVGGRLVALPIDTTYTVGSDCAGQTAGLSYFVLVGDGSEALLIRTIDGWVVTGFPKRQ